MGKTIINEDVFPKIVEQYNTGGKSAAYDYVRSIYRIKNPYFVIKRIKACGKYTYDSLTDRFLGAELDAAENVFMDIDELCGTSIAKPETLTEIMNNTRPAAMEKLIHELISDRLLTLSRYIVLDSSTKTILIDQSSMTTDGYHVVTH